jgi:hypothetical protein
VFNLRIEPVHPDKCGGLQLLGNFCFGAASPLFLTIAYFIGYLGCFLVISRDPRDIAFLLTASLALCFILLYSLPIAIIVFFLPLWNIHTKMLKARVEEEEAYTAKIAALREQIQAWLDDNQLEEAKTVKEKKELTEVLYIPYPTWPFTIKAKGLSAFLGASGSFLLGFLTALPPIILHAIFKL